MSYHFFMSYAREDKDKFLEDFYNDLKEEVRLLIPGNIENICFRDTNSIQLGEEWSQELLYALQTCKIFVALCTPTYFTRPWCGKEWQFFSDRINDYQQNLQEKQSIPLIIPIKWIPHANTPTCVAKHQDFKENLGDIYEKEGLRYLKKLHSYKYTHCVDIFAKAIMKAIEQYPLSDCKKSDSLKDVKNAFEETLNTNCKLISSIDNGGPRVVKFVYVVGNRKELSRVRKNVDSYGELGAIDWKPYFPPSNNSIMLIAQQAALSQKLISDTLEFNKNIEEELLERIRKAEAENKIVIIIVDIWTLELEQYRSIMKRYDEVRFFNSAVLVPWNNNDSETIKKEKMLIDKLKETLFRQSWRTLRTGISSPENLFENINVVLSERRNSIIEFLRVYKKAVGDRIEKLPTISAIKD